MNLKELRDSLIKARNTLSTRLAAEPSEESYYCGKIDAYSVVIEQLENIIKSEKVSA